MKLLAILLLATLAPPLPTPVPPLHAKAPVVLRSPKDAANQSGQAMAVVPPQFFTLGLKWDYVFGDTNLTGFRAFYGRDYPSMTNTCGFGMETVGFISNLLRAPNVFWYAKVLAVARYGTNEVLSDDSRIVRWPPTNAIVHFDYTGTNLQSRTSLAGSWTTRNTTSLTATNPRTGNLFVRGMGKTNPVTYWVERF